MVHSTFSGGEKDQKVAPKDLALRRSIIWLHTQTHTGTHTHTHPHQHLVITLYQKNIPKPQIPPTNTPAVYVSDNR